MPAKSEKQRKLFGAVVGCKKTGKCASAKIKKIAKGISLQDAEDFATKKTKKSLKKEHSFAHFIKMREQSEM